jgi:hypothetical protein
MQVTTPADALSSSLTSSYAIGPVDPAPFTPLHAHLSTGEEYSLLIPVQLPPSILTHATFKEGCEWGYIEGNPEEDEWTVPKLVNEVYHSFAELCCEDEPDFCPWTFGFLLRELASVAEQDRTLALTGLAHYCFLLPFLPLDDTQPWLPYRFLARTRFLHDHALRSYRAQVRVYREQGASFSEAQRLALTTPARPESTGKQEGQQNAVS